MVFYIFLTERSYLNLPLIHVNIIVLLKYNEWYEIDKKYWFYYIWAFIIIFKY